ncbi:MAG: hypothetical protein ACT4ON_04870 [Bacteroidota bacterium]
MKLLFRICVLVFICLMPLGGTAQEAKSKDKPPASSRAQRKAAKEKWKEQRQADKEHKKAVKAHHKRLQSKNTRKQMKKEKRKSEKLKANKREFFLVRWFKNRH